MVIPSVEWQERPCATTSCGRTDCHPPTGAEAAPPYSSLPPPDAERGGTGDVPRLRGTMSCRVLPLERDRWWCTFREALVPPVAPDEGEGETDDEDVGRGGSSGAGAPINAAAAATAFFFLTRSTPWLPSDEGLVAWSLTA